MISQSRTLSIQNGENEVKVTGSLLTDIRVYLHGRLVLLSLTRYIKSFRLLFMRHLDVDEVFSLPCTFQPWSSRIQMVGRCIKNDAAGHLGSKAVSASRRDVDASTQSVRVHASQS